jgi:hypothetical protein
VLEPGGLPEELPLEDREDREDRWRLGVPLIVALAFLPGLLGGFVYDDIALIRDNPRAHGLGHVVEAFTSSFWQAADSARYYRPLVTLSYLQDWSLGGGEAWTFHLTNVLLHMAASMLALSVATRWTGSRAAGILVALLVAVHPSRSQSVLWISGRPDLLMTCFALGCVELAHRGAMASRRRRPTLLALSVLVFVGALLCKESAVVVPLLLGVESLVVQGEERRRLFRLIAATGALAVGYLGVRLIAFPTHPGLGVELTPRHGFLTVFAYVERIVVPWPQTFFHRPLTATAGRLDFPVFAVGLGACICVAFTVLVARAWQRDRAAALLLLSSGVALGPLLNFIRTGLAYTSADHLLYLPLLPLFAGGARLARSRMLPSSSVAPRSLVRSPSSTPCRSAPLGRFRSARYAPGSRKAASSSSARSDPESE